MAKTESYLDINIRDVKKALSTIQPYIIKTPLKTYPELNSLLKHKVYFKLENLQKTGSFKLRGALYTVLKLREKPPKHITTYGTGNHAVALAWAASKFLNIKITAYLTDFTSEIKKYLASEYGAKVVLTKTRTEAEERATQDAEADDTILLPPSDDDDIIAGSGTTSLESLLELSEEKIDAIFAPIGGGSLVSGTSVARKALSPATKLYGAEPKSANDASISYRTDKLFTLDHSPETIADGAKALHVSQRVFRYLKYLDGIYEITEEELEYWTVWFERISSTQCEPTSALSIAAAHRWLIKQEEKKNVLVIITGHNMNEHTMHSLLKKNYTDITPDNFIPTEK